MNNKKTDQKVMTVLYGNDGLETGEVANELGVSFQTAKNSLLRLHKHSRVFTGPDFEYYPHDHTAAYDPKEK